MLKGVQQMKKLMLFVLVAILQGCANTYQSLGSNGGYSEIQLDENAFKVSYKGNGGMSKEMVADYTLLRSAEITLDKGYNYFAIVNADNLTSESTYTTPTATKTTDYDYGYGVRASNTTTTGGETIHTVEPSSANTIVCYKQKPESPFTYNAEIVAKSIRQKYGITGSSK
jgi:hypothetical protein